MAQPAAATGLAPPAGQTCATCTFWRQPVGAAAPFCCRFPVGQHTASTYWCGEWAKITPAGG